MFGSTLLLALREIRRHILRSILTTLGIIIGVAAVVTMVTVGNGVTASVQDQISSLGASNFIVFPVRTDRGTIRPFDEIDVRAVEQPEGEVTIAVVGKYTNLLDSYKSLAEALAHGGIAHQVRVRLDWVDSEVFESDAEAVQRLEGVHGILVPGGFGERGTPGKIEAVRFARERRVPFLGICFGMQMAVIEAARNRVGLKGASSTEFGACAHPVVGLMTVPPAIAYVASSETQSNSRISGSD